MTIRLGAYYNIYNNIKKTPQAAAVTHKGRIRGDAGVGAQLAGGWYTASVSAAVAPSPPSPPGSAASSVAGTWEAGGTV